MGTDGPSSLVGTEADGGAEDSLSLGKERVGRAEVMKLGPNVTNTRIISRQAKGGVSSQELLQSPPSLSIPEGENLTISCNSSTTLYALHWYRQKCDGEFVFLMLFRKGGEEKRHEKLTATLDVKMQQSSLSITAAQPSHSGTYFCGGEAQ
ncbi:T-cell receptor alpha chain V region HPB-MLT [Sciurus carolinensis]|nr:T-cell receptor alpha chain V region HPB-MLT [Sciurus carolinensis]